MTFASSRRGVFPGSFNPLTIAHLEVAEQARREHRLDVVDLVVSQVALDKPAPPGPSFEERIALLDADAAAYDWLFVKTTEQKLIVDIADGYDVVIMGADKWIQVNNASYYDSADARDAALDRLPTVVVATRSGLEIVGAEVLETDEAVHDVSSTSARAGDRDLMAPKAAEGWFD